MSLIGFVGKNGNNIKSDVFLVQDALNRTRNAPSSLLSVDGVFGPNTGRAIETFQKQYLKKQQPELLISKSSDTWKALSLVLSSSNNRAKAILVNPNVNAFLDKVAPASNRKIAWGSKVSAPFKAKVIEISKEINISPDFLMACMAFETGETFSPSIKNAAGSGAVGLIQFMEGPAKDMNTTPERLSKMSVLDQLDYVKEYLILQSIRYTRLKTIEDIYMAILYPTAIGKPSDYTLFKKGNSTYSQNKGFDRNKDGKITTSEISYKLRNKYEKGLKEGYLG